ncbi:hypothetical protein AMTRI_Chr11g99230 [Amborella trichopoda]
MNGNNRNWKPLQNLKNLNICKRWIPVERFPETVLGFSDVRVTSKRDLLPSSEVRTRGGVDLPIMVKNHSDGVDRAGIPLGNFMNLSLRRMTVDDGANDGFPWENPSPPYMVCMEADVSVSESSPYPPFGRGEKKGFLGYVLWFLLLQSLVISASFRRGWGKLWWCCLCISSSGCIHCQLRELL